MRTESKRILVSSVALLLLFTALISIVNMTRINSAVEGTLPASYDFSLVWMSDTQHYCADPSLAWIYDDMTQWIVNNKDGMKIKYVIHTGDIVNTAANDVEWQRADHSMTILDNANVPFGVLAGNHDEQDGGVNYNKYFGSRFSGKTYYHGGSDANHYDLISSNGVNFVIVYLSYGIDATERAWASSIFQTYSDRLGILAIHEYLATGGGYSGDGSALSTEVVVPNNNVFLVLCGHNHGAQLNTKKVGSRTYYEVLSDYQSLSNGGNGYQKILYFDIDQNKVHVDTYSSSLNMYGDTGCSYDEFDMTVQLSGRSTLNLKTDPSGTSWFSSTHILAAKVSQTWSNGPYGDQSTTSTAFTPTTSSLTVEVGPSDKLLLIGTSQLWNDNPAIGSSICISRTGNRISGDMFTIGTSMTHRHTATAVAIDSPGTGTYTYTLNYKTDPGGLAWASGTYLLAVKISDSSSDGPTGDQSTTSTTFMSTSETISINLASGEQLLLIGTCQMWNDNPSIGSSICISRDGTRLSGDMFTVGANSIHRHSATAIAVDSTLGTHTYRLDFKTDPGGKAWASGTYLLAVKISGSQSDGPTGDQSTVSTTFDYTTESVSTTLSSGEKLLLIGTGQLWNDNPFIGSSIAICRDGTRISSDMFTIGASLGHRHLATVVAVWTEP